jgi:hypothetical protein
MALSGKQEFVVGNCLVRVEAGKVDLPGVDGWVGTWAIYRIPPREDSMPDRYGDTDVQASEAVALGMAKAIASAVAASL